MEPRFTSWLTHSQYSRKRDDLEREYVSYRPPVVPLWPRLVRATRHYLAVLFLALGARLSDESRVTDPVADIEPVARTP